MHECVLQEEFKFHIDLGISSVGNEDVVIQLFIGLLLLHEA